MRALSIRQPWAELILRGVKTVEFRSRPTRIVGERFWIYAAKGGRWKDEVRRMADERDGRRIVGDNIAAVGGATGGPPRWMLELAELLIVDKLPTGLIVGSAVIERCVPVVQPSALGLQPSYEWHLAGVEREGTLRKPTGHPQPVWFRPW